MCSNMWREFGLAGDWRNQTSQVAWLASLALAQRIQALEVGAGQRLGQCPVDAPVRPRHRLGAKALDHLERRRDDVFTAQHAKRIADQHDALVGLQRHSVGAWVAWRKWRRPNGANPR